MQIRRDLSNGSDVRFQLVTGDWRTSKIHSYDEHGVTLDEGDGDYIYLPWSAVVQLHFSAGEDVDVLDTIG